MAAIFSSRPRPCVMCGAEVMLESVTSQHPGAPEMIRAPEWAWVGYVQGDVQLEMVVACSLACVEKLLAE